jgi:hypothetical protein
MEKAAERPRSRAGDSKGSGSKPADKTVLHPEVVAAQVKDVLSLLLVFRFINALCVRTFFQPDEYFQALEPAWDVAFGSESGAWLTWVRSSRLHCTSWKCLHCAGMASPTPFVITPSDLWGCV